MRSPPSDGGHAERRGRHLVLVEQAGILQDRGADLESDGPGFEHRDRELGAVHGAVEAGAGQDRGDAGRVRLAHPFELQDDGAVLLPPASRPARDEALDRWIVQEGEHTASVGEASAGYNRGSR